MTTMTSAEIEEYRAAVEAQMSDLPPEARDDLLEDLASHLTEVAAEGEGSLAQRLGDPLAYAAELRLAAGLVPVAEVRDHPGRRFTELLVTGQSVVRNLDYSGGTLLGYPRLRDCLRALRPAWWVLRGWVLAQIVVRPGSAGHEAIPALGNGGSHASRFAGALVLLGCIAVSIWLGRATVALAQRAQRVLLAVSVVLALYGAVLLAHTGSTVYQVSDVQPAGSAFDGVTDVYVFDSEGNLVPGARLFDQNGNALQVGEAACNNGGPRADADGNVVYAYPLCTQDRGPFSGGPGALNTAGPSVGSSGEATPATSAPVPPARSAPATSAPVTSGQSTSAATSKTSAPARVSPKVSSPAGVTPSSSASARSSTTP